ncbi:MAG: 50S ribosomal protein L10 [Candidatus Berkelbacteria bacterium]|nr:50S ribosomal protein L10 [Candidatus Berkelbacteria bacterium]
MAKSKAQKKLMLEKLLAEFANKKAVFVDYSGLPVKEMENFRNSLEEKGVGFSVVKNTLAKIALTSNQIEVDAEILKRPLAIAFSADEVSGAKEVKNFTKTHENVEVLGGIIDKLFVPVTMINALSILPSREELYTKVVGSIASPLSGIVNVLAGNVRGLVSVLAQYRDKQV